MPGLESQNGLALLLVLAAIAWFIWRRNQAKAKPAAAPTVIYQTGPDRPMKLLDLHYEHQVEREAEIKRDLIKRRLDQATLEHEALVQINRIVSPVPTTPPDAPKS